ncbi:WD40 repeat protein [Actinoplanes lutulentus]|uniref:WD40 repeat protein n=1 Tax=Actinoplanes lutulentus TaxID=1287878 RepID=A0A327ZQF6_9ACTN|nr:hypothetical protein [Actinoplanes lutulentus]MBB2940818.1 WD40 repeat protein [Actinoplanes lutulentus]RAK43128.1 WD40 repeat protein [Actinoplanes lutulentus]
MTTTTATRLAEALAGRTPTVGLVGPPGPERTALIRQIYERPQPRRFRDVAWITTGPALDTDLPWQDTPDAAGMVLQIVRTLRHWEWQPTTHEPVAPYEAAAELITYAADRLLIIDEVRVREHWAVFTRFDKQGVHLLLVTADASLLPRHAVMVEMTPSPPAAIVPGRQQPATDTPSHPITDPAWMIRRMSEDGAPGLAADLAAARAAGGDNPAVVALTRTLRAEHVHFESVRDPAALSALLASRLDGIPALRSLVAALEPAAPYLANRWPPPGRLGATLIRRIRLLYVEHHFQEVIVTAGGMWVASADHRGGARISFWDSKAGRIRRSRTMDHVQSVGLTVAPDDSWLAVTVRDGNRPEAAVYDAATGKPRGELFHGLTAAASDGSWVAVGDERGEVSVHDTATMARRQCAAAHLARVTVLLAAPDGSWLASASEDGTVRITGVHTGRRRHVFAISQVTAMVAAPDGTWLAASTRTGLHLIDPVRGRHRQIHTADGFWGHLTASGDNSWLAVTWAPAEPWSMRAPDTQWRALVFDTADGSLRHTFAMTGRSGRLASAPDGSWLAAGNPMRIWDPRTGERLGGFPAGVWSSQAVAPDGSWLAAVVDEDVVILDLTGLTGEPALADPVQDLAIGPDGSWLATRTGGKVHFWDAADGRALPAQATAPDFGPVPAAGLDDPIRRDHGDRAITGAAVSPDEKWLAVVSKNVVAYPARGTEPQLRIYHRETATRAATMPAISGPRGCRWSPDGTGLFLWGEGGLHGFTWVTP